MPHLRIRRPPDLLDPHGSHYVLPSVRTCRERNIVPVHHRSFRLRQNQKIVTKITILKNTTRSITFSSSVVLQLDEVIPPVRRWHRVFCAPSVDGCIRLPPTHTLTHSARNVTPTAPPASPEYPVRHPRSRVDTGHRCCGGSRVRYSDKASCPHEDVRKPGYVVVCTVVVSCAIGGGRAPVTHLRTGRVPFGAFTHRSRTRTD